MSGTFTNYFHPNLGLTPTFGGLSLNLVFWALFCCFFLFYPIFRYFYPNLYQFRGFLSYPQLSSVWNLSQLFSSQFRPYPHFWGLTPNFSVLGTFLLFFFYFTPFFRYLYQIYINFVVYFVFIQDLGNLTLILVKLISKSNL